MIQFEVKLKHLIRRFILPTFVTGMLLSVVCIAASTSQVVQSENQTRIMPLGDSITQANKNHNSYRRLLWLQLRKANYNVDFVGSSRENMGGTSPQSDFDQDHEGHWGWRVDQVLDHIDVWASISQPDIVLIHLGTNDIIHNQSSESTIAELRKLIESLRGTNPRIKMLIAQLIPCGKRAKIQQLNKLIVKLAKDTNTQKSPVIAVDHFSDFNAKAGKDTYDGCHPNESGEKKMAERWFNALKNVL